MYIFFNQEIDKLENKYFKEFYKFGIKTFPFNKYKNQ
jgi:hypothetical protein